MDNQFDKLKSWLLFELICTVGALIWTIYAISELLELRVYGSGMTQMETYFFCGAFLLVLRIFFLSRAWWSFYGGIWKTVKATDDGTPADSTSANKYSKKKLSDPVG